MNRDDVFCATIIALLSKHSPNGVGFSPEIIESSVNIIRSCLKRNHENFSPFQIKFFEEIISNHDISTSNKKPIEPILNDDELQFMKSLF